MPILFIGHGSPMNALADNAYSRGWRALAARCPRPRAIVAVSAHWYIRGTAVTADPLPRTIHDFGGFPPALYAVSYPAPGDPVLAAKLAGCLAPTAVASSTQWGLDHGSWSVLVHMYPAADIPVVQLSVDSTLPGAGHFALGRKLGALRDDGVLILASGNIVHNLMLADWRQGVAPKPWARQFDDQVGDSILAGDFDSVLEPARFGEPGRLSVPTPEHYSPLLYVLGAARAGETAELGLRDVALGSISMTCVSFGLAPAAVAR
jgi:4,5-DOPA dioxygenase extradiol